MYMNKLRSIIINLKIINTEKQNFKTLFESLCEIYRERKKF